MMNDPSRAGRRRTSSGRRRCGRWCRAARSGVAPGGGGSRRNERASSEVCPGTAIGPAPASPACGGERRESLQPTHGAACEEHSSSFSVLVCTSTRIRPSPVVVAASPDRPNFVIDPDRRPAVGLHRVHAGARRVTGMGPLRRDVRQRADVLSVATSLLTGRYPHHTGVETNREGAKLDDRRTIASMLHRAGYRTSLYGKYLNDYSFGRGYYIPPGWDELRRVPPTTSATRSSSPAARTWSTGSSRTSTPPMSSPSRRDGSSAPPRRTSPTSCTSRSTRPAVPRSGTATRSRRRTTRARPRRHRSQRPPNFNARDRVSEPTWMGHGAAGQLEGTGTQPPRDLRDAAGSRPCGRLDRVGAAEHEAARRHVRAVPLGQRLLVRRAPTRGQGPSLRGVGPRPDARTRAGSRPGGQPAAHRHRRRSRRRSSTWPQCDHHGTSSTVARSLPCFGDGRRPSPRRSCSTAVAWDRSPRPPAGDTARTWARTGGCAPRPTSTSSTPAVNANCSTWSPTRSSS